jgi:hypothetical protein
MHDDEQDGNVMKDIKKNDSNVVNVNHREMNEEDIVAERRTMIRNPTPRRMSMICRRCWRADLL